MPLEDSYIAAIARRQNLTIATGNDKDLRRPGVKVFNPFTDPPAVDGTKLKANASDPCGASATAAAPARGGCTARPQARWRASRACRRAGRPRGFTADMCRRRRLRGSTRARFAAGWLCERMPLSAARSKVLQLRCPTRWVRRKIKIAQPSIRDYRRGWDSNPRTPVKMLLEFQSSAFDRSATSPFNATAQILLRRGRLRGAGCC